MTDDNLAFQLNGNEWAGLVADDMVALDLIRDHIGLTGAKRGCESQVCGACTIIVDGDVMSSCTLLARELHARNVRTIEGLGDDPVATQLRDGFVEAVGAQCGFCTAGQLLAAYSALSRTGIASRTDLDQAMSGNLCRCGCYVAIREVVEQLGTSAADLDGQREDPALGVGEA